MLNISEMVQDRDAVTTKDIYNLLILCIGQPFTDYH